jgi:uncharacterized membrane protein YfhO
MSLKTIIKKWLDGDNSTAQQQGIIDALNKQQQVMLQQQQAMLQQFAQMQRSDVTAPQASGTPEAENLKQQLSIAQEQIRDLQAQLANAKNQGVKDFFAQAEERHKELENRSKGRPAEEGSKSMIRIEPDVRERIELLRKAVPGTSLTRFLNQAAREKLKDIFSDPQYKPLLFEEA